MDFNIRRFYVLLAIVILIYYLADIAWSIFPNTDLLEVLWKFSFVATVCAALGYQIRSKYSELLKHPSLSDSEFRRLNAIITIRRGHITFFILFGFIVSLLLAVSNLFKLNYLTTWASWYFKLVTTALSVEVLLFLYVLLSFREIEAFKTKLDQRNRNSEEKKRLLDKFNVDKK